MTNYEVGAGNSGKPFWKLALSASIMLIMTVVCPGETYSAPAARASEKLLDCIVLKQSDFGIGEATLWLAADRAKVEIMNKHCIATTQAPDWDVTIYNTDKQYIKVSMQQWIKKGLQGLSRSKRQCFEFDAASAARRPVKLTFMGRESYRANSSVRAQTVDQIDFIYQGNAKSDLKERTLNWVYICSSDFNLSSGVNKFCQGLYLTPSRACIQLDTIKTDGTRKVQSLKTKSIKNEKLPATFFAVPEGLKLAPTISAVATGSEMEAILLEASDSNHTHK